MGVGAQRRWVSCGGGLGASSHQLRGALYEHELVSRLVANGGDWRAAMLMLGSGWLCLL
jgi:hypothetical protein